MIINTVSLTLYAAEQWGYMASDDDQSLSQRFRQSPLEHEIQHFVHMSCEAGTESCCQHRNALEDGFLVRRILLAAKGPAVKSASTDDGVWTRASITDPR